MPLNLLFLLVWAQLAAWDLLQPSLVLFAMAAMAVEDRDSKLFLLDLVHFLALVVILLGV